MDIDADTDSVNLWSFKFSKYDFNAMAIVRHGGGATIQYVGPTGMLIGTALLHTESFGLNNL